MVTNQLPVQGKLATKMLVSQEFTHGIDHWLEICMEFKQQLSQREFSILFPARGIFSFSLPRIFISNKLEPIVSWKYPACSKISSFK